MATILGFCLTMIGVKLIMTSPVPNDEEALTDLWRKYFAQRQSQWFGYYFLPYFYFSLFQLQEWSMHDLDNINLPWWAKILMGSMVVGFIIAVCHWMGLKFLTLLQLFFMVVLIPIAALCGMGVFSSGVIDATLKVLNWVFDSAAVSWTALWMTLRTEHTDQQKTGTGGKR